jgi:hypothetical protein
VYYFCSIYHYLSGEYLVATQADPLATRGYRSSLSVPGSCNIISSYGVFRNSDSRTIVYNNLASYFRHVHLLHNRFQSSSSLQKWVTLQYAICTRYSTEQGAYLFGTISEVGCTGGMFGAFLGCLEMLVESLWSNFMLVRTDYYTLDLNSIGSGQSVIIWHR